jgi:NADPH:quinone reductase-like Zn-dependent oxidoreductase
MQISKLLGARVVAVTSGADKASYLQQLGADAVVDTAAPAAAGQRLHKLVAAAAPKGEGCHVGYGWCMHIEKWGTAVIAAAVSMLFAGTSHGGRHSYSHLTSTLLLVVLLLLLLLARCKCGFCSC